LQIGSFPHHWHPPFDDLSTVPAIPPRQEPAGLVETAGGSREPEGLADLEVRSNSSGPPKSTLEKRLWIRSNV
jgi:hypothetical protein